MNALQRHKSIRVAADSFRSKEGRKVWDCTRIRRFAASSCVLSVPRNGRKPEDMGTCEGEGARFNVGIQSAHLILSPVCRLGGI